MDADLLAPGSNVFYVRGTTREHVLATIVGLLSFPECVAISYKRSGYTQLYRDCPVERLTFPIVRMESPTSERCPLPYVPWKAKEAKHSHNDIFECTRCPVAQSYTPTLIIPPKHNYWPPICDAKAPMTAFGQHSMAPPFYTNRAKVALRTRTTRTARKAPS